MKKKSIQALVSLSTLLLFFAVITSCASKTVFLTSAVVPAAEGVVKIKVDGNNNYAITLTLKSLADPQRLTPAKKMYIVWMETNENGIQKIGQLKTSTKGLSKLLTSSLRTVSPYKPIRFFITAEDNALSTYPGPTMVLQTPSIAY